MANVITFHVDGLRELGEKMRGLSSAVANKVSVQATGAGGAAGLVRNEAKLNIQRSPSIVTGSLLASVIVKKIPKSQSQLTSEHIVTVRGRGKVSKKTGVRQQSAPHAHFVEFGTVNMPAEPFLRPALDQHIGAALDKMKQRLAAGIERAVK